MGEIFISILKWLVKEARLPRFVWLFIMLAVVFLFVCAGYRVLTAKELLFGATDKFEIAVRAQERALQTQEKAQELFENAQRERAEIRAEMDKRFDDLINRLEQAKRKLRDRPLAGPPSRLIDDLSAAQMDLRAVRRGWWDDEQRALRNGNTASGEGPGGK